MKTETLVAILAILMHEIDRSGETHSRVMSRLWHLAEAEEGVDPETRAVLANVASGLEMRDEARERWKVV